MTTYGGTREFAMKVARLSRATLDEPSVEGALQGIVELAARTVDGATSVGIAIVLGDGTLATRAYTDDVVLKVDGAQSRLHEGPCLSAVKQPRELIFKINDMSAEQRWPRFAGEAARLGVGSMIACSMPAKDGGTAALSLVSSVTAAFDDTAVEMASVYAAYSSTALNQASLIASLRTAMVSRQMIGEATGILMERHRIDSRSAFRLLVEQSQHLNVKLRVVAEYVTRTGQEPERIRREELQTR